MRYLIFSLIIIIFLSSLSFLANAQETSNACTIEESDKITNIYMSTGIDTDPDQTATATYLLLTAYKTQLEGLRDTEEEFSDERFVFLAATNDTQGFVTDIVQVLKQKAEERGVSDEGITGYELYQWLQNGLNSEQVRRRIAVSVAIVNKSVVSGLITDALLEDLGEDLLETQADAISDANSVNERHINFYQSDLLAGKRVIVVAHSQGNLFANEAVERVKNQIPNARESIDIVGVASPAGRVIDDSFYVTADDDRVIFALRLTDTVLPSNIDNDPGFLGDFRDIFNHNFKKSYFDTRLPSRTRIDNEIISLANTLPYPTVIAGEGAIRATLTWGVQPDMDLHAFEPNGAHVFYRNINGPSGMLDVDDTNSFGPENYFVPCDKAEVGTYRVGVNYFSGDGPETATVALSLGNGQTVSPRSITLTQGIGTSGNNNPSILFEVTISQPSSGVYEYTVN